MSDQPSSDVACQAPGQVALVIPALDPEDRLVGLVDQIAPQWHGPIVIVDDGSTTDEARHVFDALRVLGCDVIEHAANLGKGRALKTAFDECLVRYPDIVGCVTADADGQHDVTDILTCAQTLRDHPDELVVGCRDFSAADVPTHNMLGNRITRTAMRLLCGVRVSDTQTGLRGIPRAFMKVLLSVSGERFEFETNMLLESKRQHIDIIEVPIKTIYIDQGRASKFHVVRDSLSIYLLLVKYAASSMFATLLDLVLYAILLPIAVALGTGLGAIAVATVVARVVSAAVNFTINRSVVFRSEGSLSRDALRYIALCIAVMIASASIVTLVCAITQLPSLPVKIVVDLLLFFVNYTVQRIWVFPTKGKTEGSK